MSDRRWLRHGVRIGTTEYRRTLRGLRQDSLRLFLVGGAVLAVLAVTAFLVLLMRLFLADLEPTPLPAMLAGLTVPFWGRSFIYMPRGALSRTGRIDAESLMLTTTSTRAVVTGLVIAELLRGATYLALPTIILAGAFAATVGGTTLGALYPTRGHYTPRECWYRRVHAWSRRRDARFDLTVHRSI